MPDPIEEEDEDISGGKGSAVAGRALRALGGGCAIGRKGKSVGVRACARELRKNGQELVDFSGGLQILLGVTNSSVVQFYF